jgi:hypothetical protein
LLVPPKLPSVQAFHLVPSFVTITRRDLRGQALCRE